METFVDDLLDLTQMKAGVFNLVPAPFDQEEVFNFILSMFEPRAQAKGIKILKKKMMETNEQPIKLIGDERRYKQVMINLVKNAIKFTTEGFIEIGQIYKEQDKRLHVVVRDTGVGIAQEDLSKLFSRFGKLHRTASMNNEGIGLGLTIVRQIVE